MRVIPHIIPWFLYCFWCHTVFGTTRIFWLESEWCKWSYYATSSRFRDIIFVRTKENALQKWITKNGTVFYIWINNNYRIDKNEGITPPMQPNILKTISKKLLNIYNWEQNMWCNRKLWETKFCVRERLLDLDFS